MAGRKDTKTLHVKGDSIRRPMDHRDWQLRVQAEGFTRPTSAGAEREGPKPICWPSEEQLGVHARAQESRENLGERQGVLFSMATNNRTSGRVKLWLPVAG